VQAGRFGGAQQSAQVLRVLERIEQEQEGLFSTPVGEVEDIRQGALRVTADLERHALVIGGNPLKLWARSRLDRKPARLSQLENFGELAFLLGALGDQQGKCLPAPGAQGFVDRISPVDEFTHGSAPG
jgi:hypothetical protein